MLKTKLSSSTWIVIISSLYLVFVSLFIGLKLEHFLLVSLYLLLYFFNHRTRKLILAFSIFFVFGIIYDMMKVYPNYRIHHVDIENLYHFEKQVFGLTYQNRVVTLNEFFLENHSPLLDFLSGFFYLNWVPVPLGLALFFFVKNKKEFLDFSLTFLLVNILGFIIYYVYPAAPPWYVQLYHFDFHLDVPGNPAGLARFDQLIQIPVFQSIYTRNSNVFAAIPSLHCAYPVVVLYYAVKNRMGWICWFFLIFMLGIWGAAIYSSHHYVTDVVCGIICSLSGIFIFEVVLSRNGSFKNWKRKYLQAIS